jgi:hypothetical protein
VVLLSTGKLYTPSTPEHIFYVIYILLLFCSRMYKYFNLIKRYVKCNDTEY